MNVTTLSAERNICLRTLISTWFGVLLMAASVACSPDSGLLDDTPSSNAILEDDDGLSGGSGTTAFGIPDQEIILGGVPWVSQIFTCQSWDQTKICGPTSAAMAMRYFNTGPLDEKFVKDLVTSLGQTWPCGNFTNVTMISNLLTQKGVPNTVKIFDANSLTAALKAGHPVITPVYGQNFSTNQIKTSGNVGHFMLVVGANSREIIANDPGRSLMVNGEYRHFNLSDYASAWWGNGKYKGIEVGATCNGPMTQPCGACGTQTRSCIGGVWSNWSNCWTGSCIAPMVSLSPTQGPRGTLFSVQGKGFMPYATINATVVRPDLSELQLPQTTADASGNYVYSLQTSSNTLLGQFGYMATDAVSGKISNMAMFNVVMNGPATVSITPSQGTKGSTFSLNGSGFTSGSQIQITVIRPDGSVVPFSTTSDASGIMQFSITTSSTTLTGVFSVTVTDGNSRTAQSKFTVA